MDKSLRTYSERNGPKRGKIRQDYISEYTKWLIDRKEEAKYVEDIADIEYYTEQIKKQAKRDKVKWINTITKETMESDEIWEGMRTIARGYKPTRYAKKDRHGNIVDLKDRAKATMEYLEQEHWGSKEERILTYIEKARKKHPCKQMQRHNKKQQQ